jgi:hypothetical protein
VRLRSPRWILGTARLRAREAVRDRRGRWRRRPGSARIVPRPRYAARGARRLEPTHALVASDLNARYLDCWPLARRAWRELVGFEPLLVLVAEPERVPAELAAAPDVVVFPPVDGVHTAFQAQCIRLLYPALLETDGGAVVTSDVDMAPLGARFFTRPVEHVDASHFVAYRDVLLELGEIPVCYNAARPATWSSVFDVSDLDDVRARLEAWARDVGYTGEHGGDGWNTDQLILYRTLVERGRARGDVWILDDYFTRFRRLMRVRVAKWGELTAEGRANIAARRYTDYDLLLPNEGRNRELNELVLDVAAEAAG